MAETINTRLLILGGGPGGYVAAIRAGQLGIDTVLLEGDRLGGTCLIRGCIPSKALIHVASKFEGMVEAAAGAKDGISLSAPPSLDMARTVAWKETVVDKLNGGVTALLKRAKTRVVTGWGRFSDAKTCHVETRDGPVTIKAETVILAAGSVATALPHIPFGDDVISSTEALALQALPKRLVVIGAGYIGLELGSAFRKFGCEVTVVEAQNRILPLYDEPLTKPVKTWLEKAGVALHLSAKATDWAKGQLTVEKDGETLRIPADKLLVTVGRRPNTEGWGLEEMGVDMAGAFVHVNDRMQTSMSGVYAIGDLVGEPMLEHKAVAQAHVAVEVIAGQNRTFDPEAIAAVCFTDPEIVSAGLLPKEAEAAGHDPVSAIFPFQANGRALSMEAGDTGGFVRVVARKTDHRVVGLQAVGAHVSELSGEFAMSIEMGARLEDLAGTIHVHPTLSEAVHEAALRALGHAIHI
ncbi:MAG: lpdA [Phenylobacterium sp.]|uniref:dihydrolipoyl dehydrogenase n=1 Tax=Phenylobacterium sp. TaxID=1871053 RepID=UPI00260BE4E6|nr:dihydrolipoyl dehydrogenase [Phenylobacterium sp.]MDB5497820.1 lpdA [Phenylobacterium sp.]